MKTNHPVTNLTNLKLIGETIGHIRGVTSRLLSASLEEANVINETFPVIKRKENQNCLFEDDIRNHLLDTFKHAVKLLEGEKS